MRGWIIGGMVVLVLLALLVGKTFRDRDWGRYLRLMQQGAASEGVVSSVETTPPCRARYSFKVAGVLYSGSSPVCGIKAGQRIQVTYLPADPTLSCLGSPGARLADEIVFRFLGQFSFPELS